MEKATLTALKKVLGQLDDYSAKLKKVTAVLNAAIEKEGKTPPKAKAPKKPVATVKTTVKSTRQNAEVKTQKKLVQGKTQKAAPAKPVKVAAPVVTKSQKAPKAKAPAQKTAKKQKPDLALKAPVKTAKLPATVPAAPVEQPKAKRGRPPKNSSK